MRWCFLLMLFVAVNANSCNTSLDELEKHLYNGQFNKQELNKAFFPEMQRTSRYIRVDYVFEGDNLEDECKVTYFWSVGGFLLIQPPKVFQFTSLFFSYPANDIEGITLTLPKECRSLVDDGNGTCRCKGDGYTLLDVLTHHLFQYSKYNIPAQIIRDEKSAVRTVCREKLYEYATWRVKLFLSTIALLPFGTIIIMSFFLRKCKTKIETSLQKPTNHHNLAALVLTGITVMVYVIVMDIGAIFYVHYDHEYVNTALSGEFNLSITYVTFCIDTLIVIYSFSAYFLYFSSYCCYDEVPDSMLHYYEYLFKLIFYLMLGAHKNEQKKLWKNECQNDPESGRKNNDHELNEHKQSQREKWIFVSVSYAILFCISSHIGYIFVAWLTEPERTSSISIVVVVILLYFFLMYREAYDFSKQILYKKKKFTAKKWERILLYLRLSPCGMFFCCATGEDAPANSESQESANASIDNNAAEPCLNSQEISAAAGNDAAELGTGSQENIAAAERQWWSCTWYTTGGSVATEADSEPWENNASRDNAAGPGWTKQENNTTESNATAELGSRSWENHADNTAAGHGLEGQENVEFNLAAFLIALSWAPMFIVPVIFCLSAFLLLPIPAIELAGYLESIVEIVLVLVASLVTYRILSLKDSDATRFIRKIREKYMKVDKSTCSNNNKPKVIEDEFEATGELAGEILHMIKEKCKHN